MTALADAYEALGAVLRAVDGLKVFQPGDPVDPPAAVLMPPEAEWGAFSPDPTTARLILVLVVPRDERSLDRLLELVPRIAVFIEDADRVDASVTRADPAAYTAGRDELPAYALTVEVSL